MKKLKKIFIGGVSVVIILMSILIISSIVTHKDYVISEYDVAIENLDKELNEIEKINNEINEYKALIKSYDDYEIWSKEIKSKIETEEKNANENSMKLEELRGK